MKSHLLILLVASFLFTGISAQASSLGTEGGNGNPPVPEYPEAFRYDCLIQMARSYNTSAGASGLKMEAKVSMTEKESYNDYGVINLEKLNWTVTSQKASPVPLPMNFKFQSLHLKFEKTADDFDVILTLDLNQPSVFSKSILNTHRSTQMSFSRSQAIVVDGNLDENAESTDGSFVTIRNTTAITAKCERVQ